ncbi:hypothetical protein CGCF415_v015617 [Colletotrichum fructicola]|uniref:Uncharacterized protein n=1 Tax=Colletotrichum fructicola (strain Nara gc5) TaxID=1213859 RepID=L2GGS0_COLFN|nr:uncharacterized protein CGMCC3_g17540 [Colletotrichum fructicola]KAF4482477.1 hypothetical protein CGGC5_v008663 [Colletotrichum fructicola Nara gc5]KAE9566282.1 hypothetical protein CGMCC3_g17540 [Colletotrichum fructicola]KAF4430066.1 hypothetical protein CFRS1_v010804 [Colletotrichum fructicola]KAF4881298.1 hypothetical protein CGCFRS4_v015701 [Colletotrichum fructicola]KAF4884409.1 hypothetical protein CGCF415_v015617 [Colletotrichum fructicola]
MNTTLKSLLSFGLVAWFTAVKLAAAVKLSDHTQDLFEESMNFLDKIYDPAAGYLYFFYFPLAAGKHETRSSVWYATGLLQRNEGDDVEQAVKIIKNVIADQKKVPQEQWYGDYTVYPEEPTVGSPAYPKNIFNSWDPNWRGFIGSNLIVIYEEFRHLISEDIQMLILESMRNNTVGDSYRVGGVDDDVLYPSYSNPALMRAVATGWTGRMLNDSNMTAAGELYAREILDLFDRNDTLSEFNSPTYAGVSLYALTMWTKYMPESSLMGQNGARMIEAVWETIGNMYNANLRNIAGPWDRTYGFDMNQYVAILNIYIWSLVGKSQAPGIDQTWSMAHADDFEYAPLISVLAPYHDALVPKSVIQKLVSFPGEHMYETTAISPPHDLTPRNVTAWLSDNVTIGAESYDEDTLGGPRQDSLQWSPAAIQWARNDGSIGYVVLHGTEQAMEVEVGPGQLTLAYPRGNASSIFTFIASSNPIGGKRDVQGFGDLDGINITTTGSVLPDPDISFCGLVGGTCSIIHGFEFWNITYAMPPNASATPSITFNINP